LPCADVIISDIMMPKMDGIEFFKNQRQRGCKAPDANKALMSASVSPLQQTAVAELGCHFIRKPFHIAEIRQWLEECGERISSGRERMQRAESSPFHACVPGKDPVEWSPSCD
jgi:CheY-like chemotaxis protein